MEEQQTPTSDDIFANAEVVKYIDGKAITLNMKGETVSEKQLAPTSMWDGLIDAPDEEVMGDAPDEEAQEEEAAGDGQEAPKADAKADDEKKGPTLEEQLAELREENARLRQAQQAPAPRQRKKPARPDLSDAPDWNDPEKFDSPEAIAKGQKEFLDGKLDAYEKAQEAQEAEAEQQAEEERRVERTQQALAELRRETADLDDGEFNQRFRNIGFLQHPEWKGQDDGPPNKVYSTLMRMRELYMERRAGSGMVMASHETGPQIAAEQVRDQEFAKAVSTMVPNTPESGYLMLAIAQSERPTRLLRYFVTEGGNKQAQELSKDRGVGRMSKAQRSVFASEVRDDVRQIEHELKVRESGGSDTSSEPDEPREKPRPAPPPRKRTSPAMRTRPSRAANASSGTTRASRPTGTRDKGPKYGTKEWTRSVIKQALKQRDEEGRGWTSI